MLVFGISSLGQKESEPATELIYHTDARSYFEPTVPKNHSSATCITGTRSPSNLARVGRRASGREDEDGERQPFLCLLLIHPHYWGKLKM